MWPRSGRIKLTVLPGVILGVATTLGLTRLLESLLYQVEGLDLVVLVGVAVLGLAVVALASYGPARRASAIDPGGCTPAGVKRRNWYGMISERPASPAHEPQPLAKGARGPRSVTTIIYHTRETLTQ